MQNIGPDGRTFDDAKLEEMINAVLDDADGSAASMTAELVQFAKDLKEVTEMMGKLTSQGAEFKLPTRIAFLFEMTTDPELLEARPANPQETRLRELVVGYMCGANGAPGPVAVLLLRAALRAAYRLGQGHSDQGPQLDDDLSNFLNSLS